MKNQIITIVIIILLCSFKLWASNYIWVENETKSGHFNAIDNCDSLNIMALADSMGAYKKILKSTDGGITWFKVYDELRDTMNIIMSNDLSYPTKDFCIVVCDSGIIIKTTDGGKTWKQIRTGFIYDNYGFDEVDMFDEKHGVMTTGFNTIVSDDGFDTWDTMIFNENIRVSHPNMLSPNIIYFLTTSIPENQTYIYKTIDRGKTWKKEKYPNPYPQFVGTYKMKFLDTLFGYTVGGERRRQDDSRWDMIFRTTDGGKTWVKVLDTFAFVPYGLKDLDVLDRNNAIFSGSYGKIYWTHDGGNSFIYDSNALLYYRDPPTQHVAIIGEHTAIVVNFDGRIFRSSLATDIGETIVESYYHISPNPAGDFIEINTSNHTLKGVVDDIRFYDVLGVELTTPSLRDTPPYQGGEIIRIDISGLAPGVYFVRIGNYKQKFVKL